LLAEVIFRQRKLEGYRLLPVQIVETVPRLEN